MFDPKIPYDNLPLLPLHLEDGGHLETRPILRKCIEAGSALARLNATGKLVPNQNVLINTIPLLEAKDSSQIENIVTTTDELFMYAVAEAHEKPDAHTKEALRYRTALHEGFHGLRSRPLSTATAEEICSVIKGKPMAIRRTPGTTLANDRTKRVIYTPPSSEAIIRVKLSNWEKFMHEAVDIHPLVRMAAAHYQFEAVHPFSDGNGRTGRVLNLLYLVSEGLLEQPILYLSRHILAHRSDYYQLLLGVTAKDDWEPWILYMLDAVQQTADWTFAKLIAIRDLFQHTKEYMKANATSVYSHELLDVLFTQPYCRITNIVDAGIVQREAASRYLQKLVEINILEEKKVGRDKVFLNRTFLDLLTHDDHEFVPYELG